jgi:hypothetical protein
LKKTLQPFDKKYLEIFNDLRKLYTVIRQEKYAAAGKMLPVGDLLNFDEQKDLAEYLNLFATCLSLGFRDKIRIFDLNLSNTLQSTIYKALLQG